jgi:hypothetical protein
MRQAQVTIDGIALPVVHYAIEPADYAGTWDGNMSIGTLAYSGSLDSQVDYDDVVIWQE